MLVVAIIAPGAMGAGVAQRLVENGVEVRTLLEGRSKASRARAEACGMRGASEAEIAEADIVLSIVPPAEAMPLAQRLAPVFAATARQPVYADCNAVSPQSVLEIAAVIGASGTPFIDAGIIGLPPKPGGQAPVFYAAGSEAGALMPLADHGIPVKLLIGPVGAASGLKMSYAGITKGMTGLAAAMMLAATRFGAADDLRAELARSQPQLLARFQKGIPDMLPKAYRWVAEMEEIAAFAGEDVASQQIYQGIAALYERIARDLNGDQAEVALLRSFVEGA